MLARDPSLPTAPERPIPALSPMLCVAHPPRTAGHSPLARFVRMAGHRVLSRSWFAWLGPRPYTAPP